MAVSPKEEPETLTSPLEGAVRGVQVTTAGWEGGTMATLNTVRKTGSHCAEYSQWDILIIANRVHQKLYLPVHYKGREARPTYIVYGKVQSLAVSISLSQTSITKKRCKEMRQLILGNCRQYPILISVHFSFVTDEDPRGQNVLPIYCPSLQCVCSVTVHSMP